LPWENGYVPIEAGQQLLHYRLIDKIGEGGMGVVWKAVDTTLDRQVAIKLLPAAFTDDPERLARFEREAKVLASLNCTRPRASVSCRWSWSTARIWRSV
jgi:serine/threonine protein kinase